MSAAANVTFYAAYKDAGISPDLVVTVGIRALLAFVGLIMNLALIHVTIRSKSLRSICNILIALETASISLFLPVNIFGFGVVLSGVNFISSSLCCYIIEPLPLLGLNFSIAAMLFVAVDRFLSVFQPIWHAHRKHSTYILFIFAICLLYGLFMVQLLLGSVRPDAPTMCSQASDCMQNGIGNQYSTNVMVINGVTVGFYIGIWLMLKHRAGHSTASQNVVTYTRRIFKPLCALVSVYMVSYVLNASFRIFIYPLLRMTPVQQAFMSSYLTAFSNVSMACNAPILYAFSTEYRKAFNQTFGWRCGQNSVATTNFGPSVTWNSRGPNNTQRHATMSRQNDFAQRQ